MAPQHLPSRPISPPDDADGVDDDLLDDDDGPMAEVIELRTRLPLPPDRRPPPSVDKYDQLLSHVQNPAVNKENA